MTANAITSANSSIAYSDEAKLRPYIPKKNLEFVPTAAILAPIEHSPKEILSQIFSYLDKPRDLANVSEVCKRFYLASKAPAIWKSLLKNNLPNVQVLSPCAFSAEHQVKIIFQRIFAERKQLDLNCQTAVDQLDKLVGDGFIRDCQSLGHLKNLSLVEARKVIHVARFSSWGQIPRESETYFLKGILESTKPLQDTLYQQTDQWLEAVSGPTKYNDQAEVDSLIRRSEALATPPTETTKTYAVCKGVYIIIINHKKNVRNL